MVARSVDDLTTALIPARRIAVPVRPYDEIETGFGAVLLTNRGEAVGPVIHHLIGEKAVTEIRDLHDHWLLIQRKKSQRRRPCLG